MKMKFFNRFGLRKQFTLFIFSLLGVLFTTLGFFVYYYANWSITTRNTLRVQGQLDDFVNMFDMQYELKTHEVSNYMKMAHMVFYEHYHGDIQERRDKVHYKAINQETKDTIDLELNTWVKSGIVLQNNSRIIDEISELGPQTVTIFQRFNKGFIRIASNVKDKNGRRAIGTYIPNSSPVVKTVLDGETYQGRALVVDNWYTTNYEPIYIDGEVKGMLYVGEPETNLKMIRDIFDQKRVLSTGHPFIASNNDQYKGLMVVDHYVAGENWLKSDNERKREYFKNLIYAYEDKTQIYKNEKEGGNTVFSFETKSPLSENQLVVFFEYYEPLDYFIGIVIPKNDFVTTAVNRLVTIIISVIIFFMLVSVFLVNRFIGKITHVVRKVVFALNSLSIGKLPEPLIVDRNDEIGDIAAGINKLTIASEEQMHFAKSIGKADFSLRYEKLSAEDELGEALIKMKKDLFQLINEQKAINWAQSSLNDINSFLQQDFDLNELANGLLSKLHDLMDYKVAALYLAKEKELKLIGSYAFTNRKANNNTIAFGEGLAGQVALEKKTIIFNKPPEDYMAIESGLGSAPARKIIDIPLLYKNKLIAVLEMACSDDHLDEYKMDFIEQITEPIAIAIQQLLLDKERQNLLDEAIKQRELAERAVQELAASEEELKQMNEMLTEQTDALKKSESELQDQQEELRVINEELEEKSESLEMQREEVQKKNDELEQASLALKEKAVELEQISQYKSEFLANMSHELRTPLNSMLILSRDLAENKDSHLDDDEIEAAQIIYKSGNDLLNLINDILDLSKIEAGKMILNLEELDLSEIGEKIDSLFSPLINEKGIQLKINTKDSAPKTIVTDPQRLDQIIKNLMSNAIKFTSEGGIEVNISKAGEEELPANLLAKGMDFIKIEVEDTGIGIPESKQEAIFSAFQQADGSTSRKYGGTGLGLSITKELVALLGGAVALRSKEGEGTCFTIFHPYKAISPESGKTPEPSIKINKKADPEPMDQNPVPQGKPTFKENAEYKLSPKEELDKLFISVSNQKDDWFLNRKIILIVDANELTLNSLIKQCHEKGFSALATNKGREALTLAKKYIPDAILLNLNLEDMDGWDLLERIKKDALTKQIPMHLIGTEEDRELAQKQGVIELISGPLAQDGIEKAIEKIQENLEGGITSILIVEDDNNLRIGMSRLMKKLKQKPLLASSAKEALEKIKSNNISLMILDLGLPDMSGHELLNLIHEDDEIRTPATIIYTGRDLSREEAMQLQDYSQSIIIKGEKSEERLLDETSLFLHQLKNGKIVEKKKSNPGDKDERFHNKTILIVDDDMRNVFALSKILSKRGMNIVKAANGKMALDKLTDHPEVDIVLMDIMMPEMDGYQAMEEIRKQNKFKKLPIIALTAKAMKGDREKCMQAGANDYLSKPLDIDKLISLMKVWLYN